MTAISISENQIINKVLDTKDFSIISDNLLTPDFFITNKSEYEFITEYYNSYKSVPDKTTFIERFTNFKLFTVDEPVKAIVDRLREEKLFRDGVVIFNKASDIMSTDANEGVKYLLSNFKDLQPNYKISSTNIIAQADKRYESYKKRQENPGDNYIGMPFKELEEDLYGFEKGNELFLILAKSSTGKSQILTVCAEYASKQGYTVGFISPEMSTESISYRFDSSRNHFSNRALQRGDMVAGYEDYIQKLKTSNERFIVSDTDDFNGKITVQKTINFCKMNKIDILFIDGLSYIKPDFITKGSTYTQIAGEVCKQLLALSNMLKIPVIGVVQSRRRSSESKDDIDTPDSESVYNSYEVTQVATRILSLQKVDDALKMYIAKNRKGIDDKSYLYNYNYDILQFQFIPSFENMGNEKVDEEQEKAQQEKIKHIF